MNIDTIEKIESKFSLFDENNAFSKARAFYYFSFIGNLFLVWWSSKFVIQMLGMLNEFEFDGIGTVITAISFVMLFGFEYLKRKFLQDTFSDYFIQKRDKKHLGKFKESLVVSILFMCLSLFMVVKGSELLSDKSEKMQTNTNNEVKAYSDSLLFKNQTQSKALDTEIAMLRANILDKHQKIKSLEDLAQTEGRTLKPLEINDIRSYETQTQQFQTRIGQLEQKLQQNELLIKNKIKEYQDNLVQTNKSGEAKNAQNVRYSLIWSCISELIVIMGIFYPVYQNYQFLLMFRDNERYYQYKQAKQLLGILYENGKLKENQTTASQEQLMKLVRLYNPTIQKKNLDEFLMLLKHMKIIMSKKGVGTITLVPMTRALETLQEHYSQN